MHGINPSGIEAAIRLLTGEPELVIVDARVIRLLMGDLANLIILGTNRELLAHDPGLRGVTVDEEAYVWDRRSPCD